MYDPSVVAWEWVSPDERAVAFARRDIAAVLPSGWHAVALVVAAGWWAFAALAVVAVVRAVQR